MSTLSDLRDRQFALRTMDAEHARARDVVKKERDAIMVELRNAGATKEDLAEALDVTREHVGVLLRKAGVN